MKIILPKKDPSVLDHHIEWFENGIFTKSTLGDYKVCGEKTRLWIEEKAPTKISRHMLEGTCLHKILEVFNRQSLWVGEVPAVVESEWNKRVDQLRPGESALLDDRTKSKLVSAFSKYLPIVNTYCLYPRESEIIFGGDGEVCVGGVSVAGHIDLIDRYPSVVDYKWIGKNSRYRKMDSPGIDALIYLEGARSLGYNPKKYRYVMFIRDTPEVEIEVKEFELTEDQIGELTYQIQDLGKGIKQKFWHEPEWGVGRGLCSPKWCPYWGRCTHTKEMK